RAVLPCDEGGKQDRRNRKTAERAWRAPAVVRRLDDREDQECHRRGRKHDSGSIGSWRARIARGGNAPSNERGPQRDDWGHGEEDALPGEVLEKPAAGDRPGGHGDADSRPPKTD